MFFRFFSSTLLKILFKSNDHKQSDIGVRLNEIEETKPKTTNIATTTAIAIITTPGLLYFCCFYSY